MTKSEYHKRYYIETNVDDLLLKALNRVKELTLLKEINSIDAKLRVLTACSKLYSPQNAADEELSAVHSAPSSDQEN
jgi:hypothetical protein